MTVEEIEERMLGNDHGNLRSRRASDDGQNDGAGGARRLPARCGIPVPTKEGLGRSRPTAQKARGPAGEVQSRTGEHAGRARDTGARAGRRCAMGAHIGHLSARRSSTIPSPQSSKVMPALDRALRTRARVSVMTGGVSFKQTSPQSPRLVVRNDSQRGSHSTAEG